MNNKNAYKSGVTRAINLVLALSFILTFAFELIPSGASATGGQVTTRSIIMGTSVPNATGVTYTVGFTPATNITHPDVIVDFCNNSSDPIVGDTCSGTAGTDVPNTSSVSCSSGWTCTAIDSNHGVYLTTTTISFTGGSAITPIAMTGITNMSNTSSGSTNSGTFYARILTYSTGGGSGETSASPGSYTDYGGVALSTATQIQISAKVYENIFFCVYETTCGTAPVLTLGNPNLVATTAYTNGTAEFTLGTNASQGVHMTMTGTTLCRSLTPTSDCEPGDANYTGTSPDVITANGASPIASTTGTAQFGMCVDSNSLPSGLTIAAPYLDGSSLPATKCHSIPTNGSGYTGNAQFGFDDNTSTGTNSSSGNLVLSSSGPFGNYNDPIAFIANIANTTPAGVYKTTLTLTAYGTF